MTLLENQAYWFGTDEQKELYRGRFEDVMYLQTYDWKQNVARRGLKLFMEGYMTFNVVKDD